MHFSQRITRCVRTKRSVARQVVSILSLSILCQTHQNLFSSGDGVSYVFFSFVTSRSKFIKVFTRQHLFTGQRGHKQFDGNPLESFGGRSAPAGFHHGHLRLLRTCSAPENSVTDTDTQRDTTPDHPTTVDGLGWRTPATSRIDDLGNPSRGGSDGGPDCRRDSGFGFGYDGGVDGRGDSNF